MGRFEDAVRQMLGAPEKADVWATIQGGGQVQIGDYTWDTEPDEISVAAAWVDPYHPSEGIQQRNRTFTSLPELWDALDAAQSTDEAINSIKTTIQNRDKH